MTYARTDTLEQRTAILRSLAARNRLVAILRIGVPIIGIILFAALTLQIYVANLSRQFGVSGISIDRNNLVVETPSYSGTGSDGTRYTMGAASARAALNNPDAIELTTTSITLNQPSGSIFTLTAPAAEMTMSRQELAIPGLATISGSDGMHGTLNDVIADMSHRDVVSRGKVNIVFHDTSSIDASSMDYDSRTQTWTFTQATVILPDTPGNAQAPAATSGAAATSSAPQ
jgi:hypothetical protein